jgi:hypothetical protein
MIASGMDLGPLSKGKGHLRSNTNFFEDNFHFLQIKNPNGFSDNAFYQLRDLISFKLVFQRESGFPMGPP